MADYYSLLSRAVTNLPKSSPASTRKAIYDRARKALTNQLRSLKPQLPESDIAREERALDDAVARLESEIETPAAAAPIAPPPSPPTAPPPVAEAPPPIAPKPPQPLPIALKPPLPPPLPGPAIAPKPPQPRPPEPPRPPAPALATPAGLLPLADALKPPTASPRAPSYIPPPVSAALARKPVEETSTPVITAELAPPEGPDNSPRLESPLEMAVAAPSVSRYENGRPRPSAPGAERSGRSRTWLWVTLGLAAGLIVSIAFAAFLTRPKKPQDLAIDTPSETSTPVAANNGQKIVERVGGATPTPTPSDTPTPVASATPTAAPTTTPPPVPAASAALPVSARAAMLVATVADAQKPAVSLGSVVWSMVPANPGQPGSVGVKADIDVPDLKLHASMILRKNVDTGLPASHTIDLRVTFDAGSPIKGVKDIALPLMRRDDPPAADALLGVRVKINDSYFLIGLNRADADVARNVDEIATRGWFDFPMQLSDDRIAKLTFEKGPEGDKAVADALAAWK